MSNLDKSLNEWVSKNLISSQQAEAIKHFESEKPESSWVLTSLLALGALVIVIGVISLVAANWYQIPDVIKLGTNFIFLGGLAYLCFRLQQESRPILFEAVLLFYMFVTLGSIGLISQVFHTNGKLYQALMLWAAMHLSTVFLSRRFFTPFIWTGILICSYFMMAMDFNIFSTDSSMNLEFMLIVLPLTCSFLTLISKSLSGDHNNTKAFRVWSLFSLLIATVASEETRFQFDGVQAGSMGYLSIWVLAFFAMVGVWLGNDYNKFQKYTLTAILATYLAHIHLDLTILNEEIILATFTILLLGFVAIFLASLKYRTSFQFILLLIGVRFLVIYFQAFGGFAQTGFGLILSGLIILGIAYSWNKYRKKLTDWAEGWSQT